MTFSVGIRLLNCFLYITLITFDLVQSHVVKTKPMTIKDNVVKINPRKSSDDMSAASSLTSLDGDADDNVKTYKPNKPSLFARKAALD